ncbi:MAG: DUF2804 domain-containing protein [Eubacteriales bacterium]
MQHLLSKGPLLDHKGVLAETGYAVSPVKTYDRKAIKGGALRIKEWDYYLVHNGRYGIALTIADNAYMGLMSATFLDFEHKTERTASPMFWLPFGSTQFPASAESGDVKKAIKGASGSFTHEDGGRRLRFHVDNFDGALPFDCDILLTDAPREYGDRHAVCRERRRFTTTTRSSPCAPRQRFSIGGTTRAFDRLLRHPRLGTRRLDYSNTWYWGAGQGIAGGHVISFNLGYGFGDTSAATENMIFVDGVCLARPVAFNIPPKTARTIFSLRGRLPRMTVDGSKARLRPF